MRKFLLLFMLMLLVFLPAGSPGADTGGERILEVVSLVRVDRDGTLHITEEITVFVQGQQIRRGIYRDFPTIYPTEGGGRYVVGFDVKEVLRNGKREPYNLEKVENGYRIRIGDADVLLNHGVHIYTIRFTTDRQLGFYGGVTELYWNIHGTGWAFAADRVTWILELPQEIPRDQLQVAGFTGFQGQRGTDWTYSIDGQGRLVMTTTRQLQPREGFTAVVQWPAGYILDSGNVVRYWFRDNMDGFITMVALLLLLLWYVPVWKRHGRNPRVGTVFPRFEPPDGYSPGAIRYINRMSYDNKTFASAILNLAVKGFLMIEETGRNKFTLNKTSSNIRPLEEDEQLIGNRLLGSRESLVLENSQHKIIGGAVDAHRRHMMKEYKGSHFLTNRRRVLPPLVLSLLAVFASGFIYAPDAAIMTLMMLLVLGVWLAAASGILATLHRRWQENPVFLNLMFLLLVSVLALAGTALLLTGLPALVPPLVLWPYTGVVLVNIVFWHLMYAPTKKGQEVSDHVAGFKMYLMAAEKERLQMSGPPEPTPELFERYLPYALALGVEKQWASQFANILGRVGTEQQQYRPAWYHGTSWQRLGAVGLAGAVATALPRTVSAASTAPGSSSGGGGGGSSGGGGGGGGGGGW